MIAPGSEKGIGLSEMAAVLAKSLPRLPTPDRLSQLMSLFGERAVVTTSFGPTSAVLLDLTARIYPNITVLNIRHGHETEETLEFIEECCRRFPIDLRVIEAPHLPVPDLNSDEFSLFQQETKVKPLRRALGEMGIWFWLSGVMHDETRMRNSMEMAHVRHGSIAIYPILDWTNRQALEYCISNDLPINSNYHDPCKGPDQSLECGLHYDN